MKYIYLLLTVFIISACSKEERYSPFNLKDGQEVEVLVSHRYGSKDDQLILLPQNQYADIPLYYFNNREPGYDYRIKARMVVPKTAPQDGHAYHLDFIEIISKEKYEGNDPFEIVLIQSPITGGGPVIILWKDDNKYWFGSQVNKIQLTHQNEEIQSQLEDIWQHREEIRQSYGAGGTHINMKWKSITATVSHDPENFGKAYLVSHIELTE